MRQFRNVPPLQYLLGFEAAARHGSFSKAAEELGLSQSAISHEMRLLEQRLGQPLFIRHGRTVALTDAGRDYQRTVTGSLDGLERGYRRLAPFRKPDSVIIYAPREFASLWLMPRLHKLRRDLPNCEPWLDTSGAAIDFENMEISIAISRDREPHPKVQAVLLGPDNLVPVASPKLLASKVRKPEELLHHTLLHAEGPDGWFEWLIAAGVVVSDVSAGLDFSDADYAISAAAQGLGVALASAALLNKSIAERRLLRAATPALETGRHWFALTTPAELAIPATARVWDWLQHEFALA